jgi:arsenite/tail-anchored protein-transporting ATPase
MSAETTHHVTTLRPIDWLDWQTRFLFFTGKGGVGKTTVASTIALRLAESGRKVLLVSTDPASNLEDVFEMTVPPTITEVLGVVGLSVMNLDPIAAALAYRDRVIGPYRGVLPATIVQNMEEQLSGACTVEIAAFNEFTALLVDQPLTHQFDHVVFDTAPTGHTLRLLSLPHAWSGYLATNRQGANCLGPLAGLEKQQQQYLDAVRVLADAAQTTMILVSRLEKSTLHEAARAGTELRALGINHQRLVLNGIFLQDSQHDALAEALQRRQEEALQTLPETLQTTPVVAVPLVASSLTGIAALRALSDQSTLPLQIKGQETVSSAALPTFDQLVAQLLQAGHGLVMMMGKGGVGKTTIASALALALARAGKRVHLSTTDPAAHLLSTLGTAMPAGLTVHRIDPAAEVQRYTQEVLTTAGPLDDEGQALLEEDLRSPCTEEIAVFRAFAYTVQEAEQGFVVLDTAPTGHTLLLLDAAQNYHREVVRTAGHVPEAVRLLLPRLRDPQFTNILVVALAETTPVHEAKRLQDDLRRAGIEPFGWVINASLFSHQTTHPLLKQRASLEWLSLQRIAQDLASRSWLVPWYPQELAGEVALSALMQPA